MCALLRGLGLYRGGRSCADADDADSPRGGTLVVVADPLRRLRAVELSAATAERQLPVENEGLSAAEVIEGRPDDVTVVGPDGTLEHFDLTSTEPIRRLADENKDAEPEH